MASAIRARLMEDMMSQQACCERPATSLGLRKDSHAISKMKPKVRIVHIFAPEVIKTDVENFRELVQRLTGKPKKRINGGGKKKEAAAEPMGTRQGHRVSWYGEIVEGDLQEEKRELWKEVSSGGFLSGFGDHVDGFFHGLGDCPTLLPLSSSDMGVIGEAYSQGN